MVFFFIYIFQDELLHATSKKERRNVAESYSSLYTGTPQDSSWNWIYASSARWISGK